MRGGLTRSEYAGHQTQHDPIPRDAAAVHNTR